jgi:arylsulfatase A-like enzyme
MRFKNYNVEAQCTPTRSALLTGRLPIRTGNCSVPLPGQGDYGLVGWEYTLGELFSDAGYATGAFGKWHVGDIEGRLPTDQGFDEWYGIKTTSDESAYTTYPLFAESGVPVPKIWEGQAGSPVRAVDDFNLKTRALMDEQIAARTAAFIPAEEWDLIEKRLDCAWVLAPVAKRLGALMQSTARYPNIKPGQEFTGYK